MKVITPEGTQESEIDNMRTSPLVVGLFDGQPRGFWYKDYGIYYGNRENVGLEIVRQGEMVFFYTQIGEYTKQYIYWNGKYSKAVRLYDLDGGLLGMATRPAQYWFREKREGSLKTVEVVSFSGGALGVFVCDGVRGFVSGAYEVGEDIAVAVISPNPSIATIHKGGGAPLFAFPCPNFSSHGRQVFCEQSLVYIGYECSLRNVWGYCVHSWHIEEGYLWTLFYSYGRPPRKERLDFLSRCSNLCLALRGKKKRIRIGGNEDTLLSIASLVYSDASEPQKRNALAWNAGMWAPSCVVFKPEMSSDSGINRKEENGVR